MKIGLEGVTVVLAGVIMAPIIAGYALCKALDSTIESVTSDDKEDKEKKDNAITADAEV